MNRLKILNILFLCAIALPSAAKEYFIAQDGGTLEQCNGLTNAPYSESANQNCALINIYELIHPGLKADDANIFRGGYEGGDIITFTNNRDGSRAEYKMGYYEQYSGSNCGDSWPYGCYVHNLPAGTAEKPTIIRGEGWDQGCPNAPQLWGSRRAARIFEFKNTNHIQFSCLDITDHDSCISASGYPDKSKICNRGKPYEWDHADVGFYFSDAQHIDFENVKVHGLTHGVMAGRVGYVTFKNVHLFANSKAGFDGDIESSGSDHNTGPVHFIDSSITFSGCGEIYNPENPAEHGMPWGCADQTHGGYGDGIGTGETGGEWLFDNSIIAFNNSDGIDLLYHSVDDGTKVIVRNSRIEGNGGNQIKTSGNALIENNSIIGNCKWFKRQHNLLGEFAEQCRGSGAALSLVTTGPDQMITVVNNTVVAEGDCLMGMAISSRAGSVTEKLNQTAYLVNNIFYGTVDNRSDWENSCFNYAENKIPHSYSFNNIIHMMKGFDDPCSTTNIPAGLSGASANTCTTGHGFDDRDFSIATNPQFHIPLSLGKNSANKLYPIEKMDQYLVNVALGKNSPAINTGFSGELYSGYSVPNLDLHGQTREGATDIGAIEFSSATQPSPPENIQIIE